MEDLKKLKEELLSVQNRINNLSSLQRFKFEYGEEHTNLLPEYQSLLDELRGKLDVFHIDSEQHRFQGIFVNTEKDRVTSILNKQIDVLVEKGLVNRYKSDVVATYNSCPIRCYTIWFTH